MKLQWILRLVMAFRMQTWQSLETSPGTTEHPRQKKNASFTKFTKLFRCAGSSKYIRQQRFQKLCLKVQYGLWLVNLPNLDRTFYGWGGDELNRALQSKAITFGVAPAPLKVFKLIKYTCSLVKPHDVFLWSYKRVAKPT